MDISSVQKSIKKFLKKHKQTFYFISTNQSKVLELAVTVGVSEHYRSNGYNISIANPKKNRTAFLIKTGARGYPWNFSHLLFERGGKTYEAHMNLLVRSAHDEGRYCVDVGITNSGAVPSKPQKSKWECAENKDLVTFAEVKKLTVYPMLLAQFVGIVHEIKPQFISGSSRLPHGFVKQSHLLPTLASLGNFSGNSSKIVDAYSRRKARIIIAENFDIRLASVRRRYKTSPFI